MFCWGNTVNGELGLGGIEEEQIHLPRRLPFSKAWNIKGVGCGENHTVIVTDDGEVYTCGSNDYGQLGHQKPRKRPEQVDTLEAFNIHQVSCGYAHTVALNEWGQIFSWGLDSVGQLGLNLGMYTVPQPKMIKSLATKQVVQVACGHSHSLALTNNGELYAWGGNNYGQLGLGTSGSCEYKPCQVKSLLGIPIAYIACGGYHSFAVSKSGSVYGWGKNDFGQLGVNDEVHAVYPTQLKTLRSQRVKYVACGLDHSAVLTQDGGVFICGAGMYGQLGHGSASNEILPRKVLELMGSTVTQITCGRQHTLAFVPSRGRVYAFGLGGSGQLGTKIARNSATPKIVLGPWVSPGGHTLMDTDQEDEEDDISPCIVKSMFSGGDQSFVTVKRLHEGVESSDYRVREPQTQIQSLRNEDIDQFLQVSNEDIVDQDLMSFVETVFSSQACINASFLLDDDEHYCCTSRNHGIDMAAAVEGFTKVSMVQNSVILELISNCITQQLLTALSPSPPDVETLRMYLILPLYHEFKDPKNFTVLQCSYGSAVLSLQTAAGKILGIWWGMMPMEYFQSLVQVYKTIVIHILMLPGTEDKSELIARDHNLEVSLEMLKKLSKINQDQGLKIPYQSFNISEITDKVDVHLDYLNWLTDKRPLLRKFGIPVLPGIYFCNYPFVFDAQAKTLLLQTDQSLQMQTAMNEAASRAVTQMFFLPMLDPRAMQFLVLNVSRDNIVHDTIIQLSKFDTSDLKKPLKVKFFGEEAEDAGGVRKEFFMLLLKEILDPKYGMFKQYDESQTIWFSEQSFEDERMYFLIGLLCGLAIYNFTIIDLPFPPVLYKKLLNEEVSLEDLKGLSVSLARNLQQLLDYDEDDVEDVFSLNFAVTREVFGETRTYLLKPGGCDILVNKENKKEFVDLYVDFILNKSVEGHFDAYDKGFHKVCGGRVLELFHSQELMALVVGNENYDWELLEDNAEYKNGYHKEHPTIRMFWEVFHDLSLEDKKKFLLYLTGSDRIPILGMKSVKVTIQQTCDDNYLPVAHTCFNLLDLPRYNTKEKLRYKLLQAIQCTHGFALA